MHDEVGDRAGQIGGGPRPRWGEPSALELAADHVEVEGDRHINVDVPDLPSRSRLRECLAQQRIGTSDLELHRAQALLTAVAEGILEEPAEVPLARFERE